MEYKTLHLPLLKAAGGDAARGIIVGYGSVFNLKDLQGDIVPRGAFTASLKSWQLIKQSPAMLWQHAPAQPCGNWQELKEDAIGLFVRGQLNLSSKTGQLAWQQIKSGAVNGLSIGYLIERSHYDTSRRARLLDVIRLEEISLVTVPANPAARVTGMKALYATQVSSRTSALARRSGIPCGQTLQK